MSRPATVPCPFCRNESSGRYKGGRFVCTSPGCSECGLIKSGGLVLNLYIRSAKLETACPFCSNLTSGRILNNRFLCTNRGCDRFMTVTVFEDEE